MTTPDLLPCPFCGGEAELFTPNWTDSYRSAAGCTKCGARTDSYLKDAEVITLWNTRAAPRWIPVTERLPEKVDDYLVKIADNLHQNRSIKILPYFHSRGWMGESKQCPVTHWMPKPEPPKEVEG